MPYQVRLTIFEGPLDLLQLIEVIITFLALLELIRLREMVAWQEGVFGEVVISAPHNLGEARRVHGSD